MWTVQTIARAPGESFDFLAAAVVRGDEVICVGQHGLTVGSRDRGDTFTKRCGTGSTLTSLWADGTRLVAAGKRDGIRVSTDGGATWVETKKSKDLERLWGDASGTLIATLVKSPGLAWRSTDGGVKWKRLEHAGTGTTVTGDDAGNWYLAAARQVAVSRDRGETWTNVALPGDALVYGAHAVDGHAWLVGAAGAIYRTRDAGTTWAAEPSGTTKRLDAIWAAGPDRAYACGEDGTLLAYDGRTWTAEAHTAGGCGFLGIAGGAGVIVVVGLGATILVRH